MVSSYRNTNPNRTTHITPFWSIHYKKKGTLGEWTFDSLFRICETYQKTRKWRIFLGSQAGGSSIKTCCFTVYLCLHVYDTCCFVFEFVFICMCYFSYHLGEYLHDWSPILKIGILFFFSISHCLTSSAKMLDFRFLRVSNILTRKVIIFIYV